MSYCVEQLSQPLHPESSSFLPREPVPPYIYNREPPRWHGGKWIQISFCMVFCPKIPVHKF
jgi:hypothetical protein